ncbi:hypothetical protein I3842_13G082800 [Carya illinoinensis]|uniref:Tim10-like domain-containing protein n=1 Tax=Carya illinoinensis TaxID=32201 RepID=A0A922D6A5_CARIL|nr:hypothetical protein I3842_13G082800 [Carya illinoinensis]
MAANNNPPSTLEKEQIFGMAEKEMEYRVELFNNTEQVYGATYQKKKVYGAKLLVVVMVYELVHKTRLTHTCFNKCVEKRYKESELNMGENSCIDRCVSKYWHVTNLIGQLLGSGRPPM